MTEYGIDQKGQVWEKGQGIDGGFLVDGGRFLRMG